jgi:hypothetical protein
MAGLCPCSSLQGSIARQDHSEVLTGQAAGQILTTLTGDDRSDSAQAVNSMIICRGIRFAMCRGMSSDPMGIFIRMVVGLGLFAIGVLLTGCDLI